MKILLSGDPADLVLTEGETVVLYTGDRVTSRGAIALTYDGTTTSFVFDPSAMATAAPEMLTARRLRRGPVENIVSNYLLDERSLPNGGSLLVTPNSTVHLSAITRVVDGLNTEGLIDAITEP